MKDHDIIAVSSQEDNFEFDKVLSGLMSVISI